MSSDTADFVAILRVLADHGCRFIVVGGIGAVLHGAPVSTFDLDLVHSRAPDNVERLLRALAELEARYRHSFGRDLRPGASHLTTPGHQLLHTRYGDLDLLGSLDGGRSYEDLLEQAVELEVAGLSLHVIRLEELIEIKRRAARDKDKFVVPILEHTLRQRDRG